MIEKMIREARSQRASDIHISEGQAVYLRIDGKLIKSDLELSDEMTRKLILSLLTKERQESIWRGEDADFARNIRWKPSESQCILSARTPRGSNSSA